MIVHENPYFSVNFIDDYYSLSFSSEQVVILPVINNSILFIKAIRPAFEDSVIELPSGAVDKGESIRKAALRELREETGININNIDRLIKMPSINTIPSRTNNFLNIFMINISMEEFRNRSKHDSEVSEILLMSFKEIIDSINQGLFFTAPFIAICLTYIVNAKQTPK